MRQERKEKSEPKFHKEYSEFFIVQQGEDADYLQESRDFLEAIEEKELLIFTSTIAEIFSPDDDIGPRREDKLLRIIQYVKRHNLNFDTIRRWYSRIIFDEDDAPRDASGWKGVAVAVPAKMEDPVGAALDVEEAQMTTTSKAPGAPPSKSAASSSGDVKEEPKEKRGRKETRPKSKDRKRSLSPKKVGLVAREQAHEDRMLWRKEHPTRDEWKESE